MKSVQGEAGVMGGRGIEMDVWRSVLQALAKGFFQTLIGVSEVAQQVNVNVPGT